MKVIVSISPAENELLLALIELGWAKVPDTVTVIISADETILPPTVGSLSGTLSGTLSVPIVSPPGPFDYFPAIFNWLIPEEGKYTNDPEDPGGPTMYGIDTKDDKEEWQAFGITDIKNLTLDQARQIYRKKYWIGCKCDTMPSPVAQVHFNYSVNTGPNQSFKFLQMSLGVNADGAWGPISMAALKAAKSPKLIALAMINLADTFYVNLAKQPRFAKDKNGWLNRNQELRGFVNALT